MKRIELEGNNDKGVSRRTVLTKGSIAALAAVFGAKGLQGLTMPEIAEAAGIPFERRRHYTFPRHVDEGENIVSYNLIDIGTLGPDPDQDVDTVFGIDFKGDIPTGALVIYQPSEVEVLETRVVGIRKTDLDIIQFRPAIGGDRFDIQRMSDFGGDSVLDVMARLHAKNTARLHQKVVYVGDIGLFETQWGDQERPFLNRIIRAQRPGRAGIIEPDFVNPRTF